MKFYRLSLLAFLYINSLYSAGIDTSGLSVDSSGKVTGELRIDAKALKSKKIENEKELSQIDTAYTNATGFNTTEEVIVESGTKNKISKGSITGEINNILVTTQQDYTNVLNIKDAIINGAYFTYSFLEQEDDEGEIRKIAVKYTGNVQNSLIKNSIITSFNGHGLSDTIFLNTYADILKYKGIDGASNENYFINSNINNLELILDKDSGTNYYRYNDKKALKVYNTNIARTLTSKTVNYIAADLYVGALEKLKEEISAEYNSLSDEASKQTLLKKFGLSLASDGSIDFSAFGDDSGVNITGDIKVGSLVLDGATITGTGSFIISELLTKQENESVISGSLNNFEAKDGDYSNISIKGDGATKAKSSNSTLNVEGLDFSGEQIINSTITAGANTKFDGTSLSDSTQNTIVSNGAIFDGDIALKDLTINNGTTLNSTNITTQDLKINDFTVDSGKVLTTNTATLTNTTLNSNLTANDSITVSGTSNINADLQATNSISINGGSLSTASNLSTKNLTIENITQTGTATGVITAEQNTIKNSTILNKIKGDLNTEANALNKYNSTLVLENSKVNIENVTVTSVNDTVDGNGVGKSIIHVENNAEFTTSFTAKELNIKDTSNNPKANSIVFAKDSKVTLDKFSVNNVDNLLGNATIEANSFDIINSDISGVKLQGGALSATGSRIVTSGSIFKANSIGAKNNITATHSTFEDLATNANERSKIEAIASTINGNFYASNLVLRTDTKVLGNIDSDTFEAYDLTLDEIMDSNNVVIDTSKYSIKANSYVVSNSKIDALLDGKLGANNEIIATADFRDNSNIRTQNLKVISLIGDNTITAGSGTIFETGVLNNKGANTIISNGATFTGDVFAKDLTLNAGTKASGSISSAKLSANDLVLTNAISSDDLNVNNSTLSNVINSNITSITGSSVVANSGAKFLADSVKAGNTITANAGSIFELGATNELNKSDINASGSKFIGDVYAKKLVLNGTNIFEQDPSMIIDATSSLSINADELIANNETIDATIKSANLSANGSILNDVSNSNISSLESTNITTNSDTKFLANSIKAGNTITANAGSVFDVGATNSLTRSDIILNGATFTELFANELSITNEASLLDGINANNIKIDGLNSLNTINILAKNGEIGNSVLDNITLNAGTLGGKLVLNKSSIKSASNYDTVVYNDSTYNLLASANNLEFYNSIINDDINANSVILNGGTFDSNKSITTKTLSMDGTTITQGLGTITASQNTIKNSTIKNEFLGGNFNVENSNIKVKDGNFDLITGLNNTFTLSGATTFKSDFNASEFNANDLDSVSSVIVTATNARLNNANMSDVTFSGGKINLTNSKIKASGVTFDVGDVNEDNTITADSTTVFNASVLNDKLKNTIVSNGATFNGDILAKDLTLNAGTQVSGSIEAGTLNINGVDFGNTNTIIADTLNLSDLKTGKLIGTGSIKSNNIVASNNSIVNIKISDNDDFYSSAVSLATVDLNLAQATDGIRANDVKLNNSIVAKKLLATNSLEANNSNFILGGTKATYTGAIVSRTNTSGADNSISLLGLAANKQFESSLIDTELVLAMLKVGSGNATLDGFFNAYYALDGIDNYRINNAYVKKEQFGDYLVYALAKPKLVKTSAVDENKSIAGIDSSNVESFANGDSKIDVALDESTANNLLAGMSSNTTVKLPNKQVEPNDPNAPIEQPNGGDAGNNNAGGGSSGSDIGNTNTSNNGNTSLDGDVFITNISMNEQAVKKARLMLSHIVYSNELEIHNLHARLSEIEFDLNLEGTWLKSNITKASVNNSDFNHAEVSAGYDRKHIMDTAELHSGFMIHAASNKDSDESIKSKTVGFSVYAMGINDKDEFISGAIKLSHFMSDYKYDKYLKDLNTSASSLMFSVEAGKKIYTNKDVYVEPSIVVSAIASPSVEIKNESVKLRKNANLDIKAKAKINAGMQIKNKLDLRMGIAYDVDVTRGAKMSVSSVNTNNKVEFKMPKESRYSANVGMGVNVGKNTKLNLNYEKSINGNLKLDHSFSINLRHTF